jgi:tryptophanyl-tRNA synthetase
VDEVNAKLKKAFTTPTRLRMTDPGVPEGCSVCQLRRIYDQRTIRPSGRSAAPRHADAFSPKRDGGGLNAALEPLRERRKMYADDPAQLDRILKQGRKKRATPLRQHA